MIATLFSTGGRTDLENVPCKKIIDFLCFLTVIAIVALWAFLIFDKTAQPQEGWYVVYGNMILNGSVPYVDFEFLYLPLYAYMSTLAVAIFGNSLLAFRIIGALLFVSIAAVVFLIFKSMTSSWIAAIGSLITVFALQGDVFFIFYDYHAVFTLFAFLSIYFVLKAMKEGREAEKNKIGSYLFLAGIMCSLATSIRPQSGVMLLIFFIVAFIVLHFLKENHRFTLKENCCFFIGFLIPILITCALLIHAGAFSACIEMTFFGDTKGSISSMLLGWTHYVYPSLIFYPLALIPLLVYFSLKISHAKISTEIADIILCFSAASFVAICIVCAFSSLDLSMELAEYNPVSVIGPSWPPVFFILGLTIFLTLSFKLAVQKIRKKGIAFFDIASLFIGGSAIVIAIGAATSGPLAFVGTGLIFGLVFVTLLHRCAELPRKTIRRGIELFSVIFVSFLIVTIVAPKIVTPYYWWGSSPLPYVEATYETDVDYFEGIELTANEKYMYEDFEEKANLYLDPSDEIYCYANIPIFYTIANKAPTVKAVVPWFDVSREATIWEDLDYLKNNNPKMMVFNDHTMVAVEAHQNLYGDKSAHYELYSWLLECRDSLDSKYEVISTYGGAYNTYLLVLK